MVHPFFGSLRSCAVFCPHLRGAACENRTAPEYRKAESGLTSDTHHETAIAPGPRAGASWRVRIGCPARGCDSNHLAPYAESRLSCAARCISSREDCEGDESDASRVDGADQGRGRHGDDTAADLEKIIDASGLYHQAKNRAQYLRAAGPVDGRGQEVP